MERECQICGKAAPLACSGCSAMFYCSAKHVRRHARQGHDTGECARMAQHLLRQEVMETAAVQIDG